MFGNNETMGYDPTATSLPNGNIQKIDAGGTAAHSRCPGLGGCAYMTPKIRHSRDLILRRSSMGALGVVSTSPLQLFVMLSLVCPSSFLYLQNYHAYDSPIAHKAYCERGVLHRDISFTNIATWYADWL